MVLSKAQHKAVQTWYGRQEVLDVVKAFYGDKDYNGLEDFLHKGCLLPLGRHDVLPDFMRDEKGEPLFPENLDPREVEDQWQDAIDIAWQVVKAKLGISHNDIHVAVADRQQQDWDSFIERAEQRKRERSSQ